MILIVEDQLDEAKVLEELLRKTGVVNQIRHVHSAIEAMAYINADFPYADRARYPFPRTILLDLRMPNMSGLEFLKWLKANDVLENFAVIVVSGIDDTATIKLAYSLGAKSFLPKPYTLLDLQNLAYVFPASLTVKPPPPASSAELR